MNQIRWLLESRMLSSTHVVKLTEDPELRWLVQCLQ